MAKKMVRGEFQQYKIDAALTAITNKIKYRLDKKGRGEYIGPHETYGIIAEEFNYELLLALHANDSVQFYKELLDIAVACVLGMASELPDDTSAAAE